jgi:hypothetical protein
MISRQFFYLPNYRLKYYPAQKGKNQHEENRCGMFPKNENHCERNEPPDITNYEKRGFTHGGY